MDKRKRGTEGDLRMGADSECAWNLLSWGAVYLPKWSVWGQLEMQDNLFNKWFWEN